MDHNADALADFIQRAAGAKTATVRRMEKLSGGAIQENWLVDLDLDDEALALVVRTDAPAGVAASLSRAEEFALLKAAFGVGMKAPEPLWLCEDAAVLGKAFFVMRRLSGTATGVRVVKDTSLGGDRNQLARDLGAELAKLHTIHPPRADIAFLPPYTEAPATRAIRLYREYLDTRDDGRPGLEWALRWLERNAPDAVPLALCHRDYRTGNYMVDGQGLTGILDWEFCDWSDPDEDLGWFCAKCWRFGANHLEAGGIAPREPFYEGYEARSGRTIDRERIFYWEVMAHVRWAVIALQQADRFVHGGEANIEAALTGHVVPELEYELLRMTG